MAEGVESDDQRNRMRWLEESNAMAEWDGCGGWRRRMQTTNSRALSQHRAHCISFDSYIKPQLVGMFNTKHRSCISFDSYIKPQLLSNNVETNFVVYLLIPTSNHNQLLIHQVRKLVVYLLIPTSNHNNERKCSRPSELYIFWFLHQTTTNCRSESLLSGCISFDSYIKPQHGVRPWWFLSVVYLLIPTSNHNNVDFL